MAFPFSHHDSESSIGNHGISIINPRMKSNQLSRYISQRDWENAVQLCRQHPYLLSIGITKLEDTVLHVAINDDQVKSVRELLDIIKTSINNNMALMAQNYRGETPLHCAAATGSVQMCELILDATPSMAADLLRIHNKWDENPIFVAVVHNRKCAFIFLHDAACPLQESYAAYEYLIKASDGDTVLHCAIKKEHLELAFLIIQRCPELSRSFNHKGMTPLEVLATTPFVFRSSYNLSWWKQIIYHCIHVDPLKYDLKPTTGTRTDSRSSKFDCPENYLLCYRLLSFFGRILSRFMKRSYTSSNGEVSSRISQHPDQLPVLAVKKEEGKSVNPTVNRSFPQNYATCYEFLAFLYLHFVGMMGFGYIFTNIRRVKQKYIWSLQLLDQLLEKSSNEEFMEYSGNAFEFRESEIFSEFGANERNHINKVEDMANKALLAAAENGVIEVVDKILRRFPGINPGDTAGQSNRNILMVAVENQQAEIFVALRQHLTKVSGKPNLWNDLVHAVDDEDNTILHIAAKYDESLSHGWQAYGTAMQLQCEITWYEYVRSFLPSHFLFQKNQNGETPVQIFTRDHKDMVKKGSAWLKDTAQSCSVVAALVAGVSFASRSVPGGTDDKGRPTLEGHPAFDLFAISGLIGLGFSVTALIMFLSILTSRKQPIDFKRNLPFKLLLGLSSLFVSIASMFISFCASHFFVLEDKFKKGIFPLYAVTCLPISFYAIAQFPLYMDLTKAIVKHVPQSQKYVQL